MKTQLLLKEKCARAAPHYAIKAIAHPETDKTRSIDWKHEEKINTRVTHSGAYHLRTNIDDRDEERLWKSYIPPGAYGLRVTANIIDKVYEKGKKACSSIYDPGTIIFDTVPRQLNYKLNNHQLKLVG